MVISILVLFFWKSFGFQFIHFVFSTGCYVFGIVFGKLTRLRIEIHSAVCDVRLNRLDYLVNLCTQYLLMDVILFVLIFLMSIIYIFMYIAYLTIRRYQVGEVVTHYSNLPHRENPYRG